MDVSTCSAEQWCAALVDLDRLAELSAEDDASLIESLLSTSEQEYFSRFHYPKRRREWLGGRIAAKAAMLNLDHSPLQGDTMHNMSILANEHGRPMADQMSHLAFSITHSRRYAAALAVAGDICGIDLQKISPKLSGLTERFTCTEEIRTVRADLSADIAETTLLTMLWSAKEALKKSLLHDQPALFSGIQIRQAVPINDRQFNFSCTVNDHRRQSVIISDFSPYILALTGDTVHA
jgi:phosphopantetheinyl transferase